MENSNKLEEIIFIEKDGELLSYLNKEKSCELIAYSINELLKEGKLKIVEGHEEFFEKLLN